MMKPTDPFMDKAVIDNIFKLHENARKVLDFLRKKPTSTAEIINVFNFSAQEANIAIGELELFDLIRRNRQFLWETKIL